MVKITEGEHELSDGHRLYTKTWEPEGQAKAKLIFVHGYSDHCNRYYNLFPTLASKAITVFSFDQRGWGRSVHNPSEKGLTGPTPLVISDLAHIITSQLPCPVPVFVMGHSMGGAEILTLASSPEYNELTGQIRGWLCESPHIALPPTAQPSLITETLGRLLTPLLPKFHLHHPISYHLLTRDPEVQKSLADDPLCNGIGTLQGLAGILDRAKELDGGKRVLNGNVRSLWMGHGSGDLTTDYGASERFCEGQVGVEDRVFRGYEGWSHQMHADLPETRDVFAGDVAEWILERCGEKE